MKYKIKMSSTIPVVQYGNIIPTIEMEGDNYPKLEKEVLSRLKSIWNRYCSTSLKENETDLKKFKKEVSFTNEEIMYNSDDHIYTDMKGNRLISGSVYAKQFAKPFDRKNILPRFAKKWEVSASLVDTMWNDNSELSRWYGNSIHKLMENWFNYGHLGCYHKPKNLILLNCLDTFPLKDKKILSEILVSDIKRKRVGRIDGIKLLEDMEMTVDIIDYKTDAQIEKNLPKHFNQLSFYAAMLIEFGYTIRKLEIWNYTDSWKCYESEVLEVKK